MKIFHMTIGQNNMRIIKYLAFALILVSACTREVEEEKVPDINPVVFTATWAESRDTKTAIQADGTSVWWTTNEQINVFRGEVYSGVFTSNNTESAPVVEFCGSFAAQDNGANTGNDKFWAVYPYDESNTCDGESVSLTIPAVQPASAGTFADKFFPAVASSTTFDLAFYNVCGGACFCVSQSGISSIIIKSVDETAIAGRVQVGFNENHRPIINSIEFAQSSIRIDAPDGCFIPGEHYYAAMLPASHAQGLQIGFNKTDGTGATKTINNSLTVHRSVFGRLYNLDQGLEFTQGGGLIDNVEDQSSSICTIEDNSLNGWDSGFTDKERCLLFKQTEDEGTIVCAYEIGAENYSFYIVLDKDESIVGLGTTSMYYNIEEKETEYIASYLSDGELSFFSIPKQASYKTSYNSGKRNALPIIAVAVFLYRAYTFYSNARQVAQIVQDLNEGRWYDFWVDVGKAASGKVVGKLLGSFSFASDFSFDMLDASDAAITKHYIGELYGNASISISSIDKQPSGSYTVFVTVSGLSSIQTSISSSIIGSIQNHIYAGIVCRKNYPAFVNYYSYKSDEIEVTGSGDSYYLTYTIPDLGKGVFSVKPYLRSSFRDIIKDKHCKLIQYGPEEFIRDIGGQITGFEQVYEEFSGGTVHFVVYAFAGIDSLDDVEDWGVYYEVGGQTQIASATWSTSKINDDIRLEIDVPRSSFDYYDYNNFVATKTISIGVFKKLVNTLSVYDYDFYEYGDMSECELVYDHKPSIAYTSATIKSCSISEYDSENGYCRYNTVVEFGWVDEGTFWMDSASRVSSDGKTGQPFSPSDGSGTSTYIWSYSNKSFKSKSSWYEIHLIDGQVINSANRIYLSGSPSSPTASVI